ncbi:cathepsin O-like [Galleria mellonella]|uniref:Cathepsin O-like n=1 Tax=Galleria mellonella TaxID=7137 RepID=A0ABM3MEB2_GALME|nr:cathepsin O-like [Galleria mellonella]
MCKWWVWVLSIVFLYLLYSAITSSGNEGALLARYDIYLEKFNKSYKNNLTEYKIRFGHFVASVREIDELNALSRGSDEYRALYGLTKLSDMSKSEYKNIHLSDERILKSPEAYGKSWREAIAKLIYYRDKSRHKGQRFHDTPVYERKKRALLPLQVDWRSKGVIGPVRNQGLCGACWAFSTIGTVEAMAAIKNGKLETLSVQEAIDCAGMGNSGCAGGDICLLLDWLMLSNTPVELDKEYPLRLASGTCSVKKNGTGVRIASFTCDEFVGAEDKILQALATHGPVTVAVNALTWQNYLGGVIQYHCSGSALDLNHAVELVGYDLSAEVPYYIAKNSWGQDFGLDGYLHLAIGSNICGLANEVATVAVK